MWGFLVTTIMTCNTRSKKIYPASQSHPIYFSGRKEKGTWIPRYHFRKRRLLVITRLKDDKEHRSHCLLNKPTNQLYLSYCQLWIKIVNQIKEVHQKNVTASSVVTHDFSVIFNTWWSLPLPYQQGSSQKVSRYGYWHRFLSFPLQCPRNSG